MFLLCVVLAAGACSRKIGDSCTSNVDCSPLGDRYCDLSSPYGYCTVEGCDQTSCPDNAACISFYSLQRGAPKCNIGLVPRSNCVGTDCCQPGTPGCCRIGERCLCNELDCTVGYCASETSEHRWCMKPCDEQSDCAPGYTCYSTNQGGAVAVPIHSDAGPSVPTVQYCAPNRGRD